MYQTSKIYTWWYTTHHLKGIKCNSPWQKAERCTGLDLKAVPRFGELCSCRCSPLLPQLACSTLATWDRPYSRALYSQLYSFHPTSDRSRSRRRPGGGGSASPSFCLSLKLFIMLCISPTAGVCMNFTKVGRPFLARSHSWSTTLCPAFLAICKQFYNQNITGISLPHLKRDTYWPLRE